MRRLSPRERYLLKEAFERLGLKWDENAEWTQFTEDELVELIENSQSQE